MSNVRNESNRLVGEHLFSGAPTYQELSAGLHRSPEVESDDPKAILDRLSMVAPIAASLIIIPPVEFDSPAPAEVRDAWRGVGLPVRARIEHFRYAGIHAVDAIYSLENQPLEDEQLEQTRAMAASWWRDYFRKTVAEELGQTPERTLNTSFLVFPTSNGELLPVSEKWFLRQQAVANQLEQ
jgi:hypothetical protein